MKLKGVSPLVAVVMLIAFTLLIAGILGAMVTQFSQQQRANIQYCSGAKAMILSGFYTSSVNSITLNIHNFGDVQLSFTVFQTGTDGTAKKVNTADVEIGANEISQFTYTLTGGDTISDIDEVTMQSKECVGVQDLVRGEDLKSF